MKEIEILVEVLETKESALRKLQKFKSGKTKDILDIYLGHPKMPDIAPQQGKKWDKSFRVRTQNGKTLLTLKKDIFNGDVWGYCEEEEIEVGEGILNMLSDLGFRELVRIENRKTVFLTDEYEIVLEEVKGLGLFLEVELLDGEIDDIDAALEQIREFIKTLGIAVGQEIGVGKPELMLRKLAK